MSETVPATPLAPETTSASSDSPYTFFITLGLLSVPYILLVRVLDLDPRDLPKPLPSLLLVLATFISVQLALPFIVLIYAPATPKGRYSGEWTATNLNIAGSSVVFCLVAGIECPYSDPTGLVVLSVIGWLVTLFFVNLVYEQDSNSPWAAEKAAKTKKKDDEQFEKQLQLERAKASGMQHKVAGEVDEGAKVLKAGEKMD